MSVTVDGCEILQHLEWLKPYKWYFYHQLVQDFFPRPDNTMGLRTIIITMNKVNYVMILCYIFILFLNSILCNVRLLLMYIYIYIYVYIIHF